MRQLIVTEWMSLDGIFDASSMDQWFNPYHSDERAEYIQETIHDCDAMIYGRKTYEMLFPYWSSCKNNEMGVAEQLNKVEKHLVSATLLEAAWENATIISQDAIEKIAALKQLQGGNILVQGSATLVKSLLEAGLVDELKLLVQPHIMGAGSRLFFEQLNVSLVCNNVRIMDKGVVATSYQPLKQS